jgi:hypothetical protein
MRYITLQKVNEMLMMASLPSGEPIRLRRSAAVAVYDVFLSSLINQSHAMKTVT